MKTLGRLASLARRSALLSGVAALSLSLAAGAQAATLIGLAGNTLFEFDSASPGTVSRSLVVTGNGADVLRGLDFRPSTGELYTFGQSGQLYTIALSSGMATPIGTPVAPVPRGLFEAGFSFNPVPDAIRITTADDVNRRVNPITGATIVDTPLAYAAGDRNAGANPNVTAVAYTNQVPGTVTSTILYGIDGRTASLVRIDQPNAGILTTVGSLGVRLFNSTVTNGFGLSFDIDGITGEAFALLLPLIGPSTLYSINLSTGAATAIGPFASAGFREITVGSLAPPPPPVPVPEPATAALLGAGLLGLFAARRRRA